MQQNYFDLDSQIMDLKQQIANKQSIQDQLLLSYINNNRLFRTYYNDKIITVGTFIDICNSKEPFFNLTLSKISKDILLGRGLPTISDYDFNKKAKNKSLLVEDIFNPFVIELLFNHFYDDWNFDNIFFHVTKK